MSLSNNLMYNRTMTTPETNALSERELDILRLVATGLSNKEIAQKLYISPNTVKVHLRNIFTKIGVLSRTEAALYAINHGLVKTSPPAPSFSLPISTPEPSYEERAAEPPQPKTKSRPALKWVLFGSAALLLLALLVLGWARVDLYLNPEPTPQPTQVIAFFPLLVSPTSTPLPRWQALPSMPTPRSKLAAVALNSLVYAIGGETAQGVSASLEIFDPASSTWTEGKSKPIPVSEIQAAVLGGKIYVPGGWQENGKVSQSLEIYDPLDDSWESGPDLPYPVSGYALAAFEGKLYLFGGWDGNTIYDRVLEYDPAVKTWSERTPLLSPRYAAAAAVAGGKIYVLGGFDGQNPLTRNETYIPSLEGSVASPWGTATPLPEGRYAMGAASIADSILVIGGVAPSSSTAASYQFFPSTSTWTELEQPSQQLWAYLASVPLDQNILALGGLQNNQVSGVMQTYQAVYTVLIPIVR
jgi:DNA-binding CsgD family transcriptional regulator/N-acetylneuraminic acid mutarotase